MCKVSVIVPVYNCEKYIKKCIDSLFCQSLKDIEIIAVNDGSKDCSLDILNSYKNYENFKIINQSNKGVSVARNNAMQIAKGNYIAFVDGDDYIDDNYLEKLYNEAEKYHSDMVFCGYRMVDVSGNLIKEMYVKQMPDGDESFVYQVMTICMRIFNREFLIKHNMSFPVGVRGEDLPFNMKVNALASNIRAIEYVGYNYVQHSSSAMNYFVGLKHFKLPMKDINDALQYIKRVGCKNSYDFLELSVFRTFTVFVFQFGRKSEKKQFYELCDSIIDVLNNNGMNRRNNELIKIKSLPNFPLVQRIAVNIFVKLYKKNKLHKYGYLFTRL